MTVKGPTVSEKKSVTKSRFEFLSVLFHKVLVPERWTKQMKTNLDGQLMFIAVDPKEPDLKRGCRKIRALETEKALLFIYPGFRKNKFRSL